MIWADKDLLVFYRGFGPCGWCGRLCNTREAAHVFAKGIGGGSRVDVPENLIGLGHWLDCGCHRRSHDGNKPTQEELIEKVATREGLLPSQCRDIVDRIRRFDGKHLSRDEQREAVQKIRAECRGVAS